MAAQLKLGKTKARPDAVKFKLAEYLDTSLLPSPPKNFGHERLVVGSWGMLGNDQYGDCVWAGAAHETMLWNREGARTAIFDDQSVLSDYSAVTGFNPNDPNTDQGTDMQVAASYRRKTGVRDAKGQRHLVTAYLAITPKDVEELKQAIYLYSAVGIGIEFPSTAMDQFNQGKPWTVVKGASVEGGHYVPAVGYNSRYLYVVTWGKVQRMSWAFYKKYNDESVVYISEEMLNGDVSLEGFNLAQLELDLKQLK